MKTLLFFESTVQSVSQSTAWYLADLGEYLGRQELYARQVPQKLKALKEADISIRKMIPITRLRKKGILKRIGPDKGGHWEIVTGK